MLTLRVLYFVILLFDGCIFLYPAETIGIWSFFSFLLLDVSFYSLLRFSKMIKEILCLGALLFNILLVRFLCTYMRVILVRPFYCNISIWILTFFI